MSTKALYIANPSRNVAEFVVHTGRSRIIEMSTSGCLARLSARIQSTATTIATANSASVFGSPQPQSGALLTPRSRATSQPERSTAPSQNTSPGDRIGDSGTKRDVATVEIAATTSGIQNSQW